MGAAGQRSYSIRSCYAPGPAAKIALPVHPHMLRHSRGTKLAKDKCPTRGHQNIQNTQIYTDFAAERFREFTGR